MTVHLNQETFELYGTCDACGAELYCIEIETGEALCSDEACDTTESFDATQFRGIVEGH